MISTFTALFDANVLFGARLRSLILWLAKTGLYRARWSGDIHAEWMAAVVKKRPDLSLADLEPTRQAMDAAVPDCLVSGYEQLIPALELPDENDRHVLAAAIVGKASVIVTFNQDDFPPTAVDRYGIHVRHPDDFLLDVDGLDQGVLVNAAIADRAHYANPPIPLDRYLADLNEAGVPLTAAHLAERRILFET